MPGFRKKSRRNRTNGGRRYRQRGGGKPKNIYDKYVNELQTKLTLQSKKQDGSQYLSVLVQEYLDAVEAKLKTETGGGLSDTDDFDSSIHADADKAERKWNAYLVPIKTAVKAVHDAEQDKKAPDGTPAPGPLVNNTAGDEQNLIIEFETFIADKTFDLDNLLDPTPVTDAKDALDTARAGAAAPGANAPAAPASVGGGKRRKSRRNKKKKAKKTHHKKKRKSRRKKRNTRRKRHY